MQRKYGWRSKSMSRYIDADELIKALNDKEVDYRADIDEVIRATPTADVEPVEAEAVQGCDGCRYNTRTPKKQCLCCKRYWRDGYERIGGGIDGVVLALERLGNALGVLKANVTGFNAEAVVALGGAKMDKE